MPNHITTVLLGATDAVSFRNFVSSSESALQQVGMVNTNASGTIDFATVVIPDNTSQARGYSVWRFPESMTL